MPRFDEKRYTQVNARVINSWIEGGWQWGMPVSHAVCEQARAGTWGVRLTPTKDMPRTWLPDPLRGTRVLGLAAGGGQQMPVLACAGAVCTVLDFSDRQIETERLVAKREGYSITTVQADMTEPLPFDDESFDVIVHPVSNCYVENVFAVWLECFRVLRPGGRLLSGLDNGFGDIFDDDYENVVRGLPFNPLRNPDLMDELDVADWGVQFSHTLEDQIRGQLRAGFRLVDCYEDTSASGRLAELNIPTFWATYSEKPRY